MIARIRDLPFDWSAAFWFAVAYLGSVFSLYPVIVVWLLFTRTGPQMDPAYAVVAPGICSLVIFAVTAFRLSVSEPWRRIPTTMFTLYLLRLGGTALLVVSQIVQAPYSALLILSSLVAPLTFGLIDITGIRPLTLAWPDVWVPLGALIGLGLARWRLKSQGRPAGPAADVHLRPLRLPKLEEINGSVKQG